MSDRPARLWIDGDGTLSTVDIGDDHERAVLKVHPDWARDPVTRALRAGWIRVNASVRELAIAIDPDRVTVLACARALKLLSHYRVGGVFLDLVPLTLAGEPIVGYDSARRVLTEAIVRGRRRRRPSVRRKSR